MSLLLDPNELKDDIISTLNICFENCTNYPNNYLSYNKKYLNDMINIFLNNNNRKIDISKICNYMNSFIQNKIMNIIISKHKELLSNQNSDNYNLFNNELLSLSINKPYNEELYKSTRDTLNNCRNNYCLHFKLSTIISIFNTDHIPYIWFYIDNLKEELKDLKKTIDNNKQDNQKEIRDLKKTIDNNENQKEIKELKQTIYFFKKELNLIIDNCKKENQKEIEEIKETIDNNQKENKKDINKSKQNIYFCKKELNLIIENNNENNKKEIETLKQIINNNNQNNQKEIKNLKETIENNNEDNENNKKEIETLKQIIENNKKNNNKEINKLKYLLFILFIYNSISIIICNAR
jgi:hypothetical protein